MTKASDADLVVLLRESGAGPVRVCRGLIVLIGVVASMALCPVGEARAQRAGALGAGNARGLAGLGTTTRATTLGTAVLGTGASPAVGTAAAPAGTATTTGTAPTTGTTAPRATTTATTTGAAAPTNPATTTGPAAPAGTAQTGVGTAATPGAAAPAGTATTAGPTAPGPSATAPTPGAGTSAGSGLASDTPSGAGTAPAGGGTTGQSQTGTTGQGRAGPRSAVTAKTPAVAAAPTGDPTAAVAAAPAASGIADGRGRADGLRRPGLLATEDDTGFWLGGILANLLRPDAPSRTSRLEEPAGSASPPDDIVPPDAGSPELRPPHDRRPRIVTAPPVQASKIRPSPRPVPILQARRDIVPDEVLLELQPRLSGDAIGPLASQYGLTEIGAQRIGLLATTVYRCRIPRGQSVGTILARLRGDQRVAAAQPNGKFRLQDDTGPGKRLADQPPVRVESTAMQWSADRLGLPAIHRRSTGRDVPIAMIDSGIDTAHPELQGGDIERLNVLDTPYTSQIHGTEIAGALSARGQLTGVAPGSRIFGIRAFDAAAVQMGAEGTSIHIAEALDLADRKGAKVLNLSFAGPADSLLHRMFAALHAKGVVIVAAAGNAGPTSPPLYPAADPNVIAVTATDAKDALYRLANRGPYISLAAPGVDVLEPAPGSAYQLTTGTSVAAAHVSGIVALLLSLDPALDPDGLRKVLTETADPIAGDRQPDSFGSGLVDAVRAIDRLKPVLPAVPPPAVPQSPAGPPAEPLPGAATAGKAASIEIRQP